MQINNVSQTSNTAQTQNNTNTNSSNGSSFSLDTLVNKDPKEITFKEYQKLSKEDIEKLYSKENQKEQYEQAISLHSKVNISDDKILNELLFDRELRADDSEVAKRALNMISFLARTWDFANTIHEVIPSSEYKNLPKDYEPAVIGKFFDSDQITAKNLFIIFDNNKLGYEANIDFYNYTPNDEEFQNYQEQIAYREGLKNEYEQRVRENNATLASYTSNSSSAQQAIYQAEQKQTTKAEPIKENDH